MIEEPILGLTFMAGPTAQHWCTKIHNIIEELRQDKKVPWE